MKPTMLFATAAILASSALAHAESPLAPKPSAPPADSGGAFVAAAKVGVALPFDGLSPMVSGVVEVGYVFPWLKRSFGLLVDVAYTVPTTNGTVHNDVRVDGSTYTWKLTQRELTLSPLVVYRLTMLGRLTPYVGVGPRFYFHQSIVEGSVGKQPIDNTTEQSTKVGLGVPVGASFKLGPGEILGEFLFEWGKLDHTATGDSSTAGGNVQLGYRMLF